MTTFIKRRLKEIGAMTFWLFILMPAFALIGAAEGVKEAVSELRWYLDTRARS